MKRLLKSRQTQMSSPDGFIYVFIYVNAAQHAPQAPILPRLPPNSLNNSLQVRCTLHLFISKSLCWLHCFGRQALAGAAAVKRQIPKVSLHVGSLMKFPSTLAYTFVIYNIGYNFYRIFMTALTKEAVCALFE